MSESINKDQLLAKQLLVTFATNGFAKTSMQSLANGAGLSRQSIYKKFASKEKCYQWMIETYLENMYVDLFTLLDNKDAEPTQTLVNVFERFIGQPIKVIAMEHGHQILNDTLIATHRSHQEWPLRFRTRLAQYLHHHNLVSQEKSLGVAFTLISAAKGLLAEASIEGQVAQNMALIIASVTNIKFSESHH